MKPFEEIFDKELKSLKNQDELLDIELRSILSHAMLGDDHADNIKKETFDLMVSSMADFIWDIQLKRYKIRKVYSCRLDEMQCSEECHGNQKQKEKCSCCTITSYLERKCD